MGAYAKQVKANATALAAYMVGKGYKLATNGTENHLMLWDLRPLGLTGNKMEKVLEKIHITLNKNAVHGDVSAMAPGGVRIGAPAELIPRDDSAGQGDGGDKQRNDEMYI